MKNNKDAELVQLVKGKFTPHEASTVVMSLLNEKIKFHNLERLQRWERDHRSNPEDLDSRIKELELAKEKAQAFIEKAAQLEKEVSIDGVLQLSLAK